MTSDEYLAAGLGRDLERGRLRLPDLCYVAAEPEAAKRFAGLLRAEGARVEVHKRRVTAANAVRVVWACVIVGRRKACGKSAASVRQTEGALG